eukprot:GSChrysophyteH2.ASY1.ANO1.404.1 assembled CDS
MELKDAQLSVTKLNEQVDTLHTVKTDTMTKTKELAATMTAAKINDLKAEQDEVINSMKMEVEASILKAKKLSEENKELVEQLDSSAEQLLKQTATATILKRDIELFKQTIQDAATTQKTHEGALEKERSAVEAIRVEHDEMLLKLRKDHMEELLISQKQLQDTTEHLSRVEKDLNAERNMQTTALKNSNASNVELLSVQEAHKNDLSKLHLEAEKNAQKTAKMVELHEESLLTMQNEKQELIAKLEAQIAQHETSHKATLQLHKNAIEGIKKEHSDVLKASQDEHDMALNAMRGTQASGKDEHAVALQALADAHTEQTETRQAAHAMEIAGVRDEHAVALQALADAHTEQTETRQAAHAMEIAGVRDEHAVALQALADAHTEQTETRQAAHATEIAGVRDEHAVALQALADAHTEQTETRQAAHATEIAGVRDEHAVALQALADTHSMALAQMKAESDIKTNELTVKHRSQLVSAQTAAAKLEMQCSDINETLKSKEEECVVLESQLTECQTELSTCKISFTELQKEFNSLNDVKLSIEKEYVALQDEFDVRMNSAMEKKDAQCTKEISQAVKESVTEKDKYILRYTKESKLRRAVHNKLLELQGNIRVLCRVRPVLDVERRQAAGQDVDITEISSDQDIIITRDEGNQRTKFEYDSIFSTTSSQKDIFSAVQPLCHSVLDGYNVCIFAYGQTGSGKTFTMEGVGVGDDAGITPRAIASLFDATKRVLSWTYRFELQILEIYNEKIIDLQSTESGLDLRQTKTGMTVIGLTSTPVSTPAEVNVILDTARKNRAVGSHDMNEHSSRSHCILTLHTYGTNHIDKRESYGKMHLVDLAGSERQSKTEAAGDRLKEANAINKSLSCLGDVIGALGNAKKGEHIPYRNSKLTHLLSDSLGGNSKVMMVVNISPAVYNEGETVCSLNFASRCRNVELGQARKNVRASTKIEA